jgi:hypothetical protein
MAGVKMSNIVIFYVPGSYGSFLAWMIERFNTARKEHVPAIVDNPVQADGSSHGHATYCKVVNMDQVQQFLEDKDFPDWGYKIWAGWPVSADKTLDQCIQETLSSMDSNDRLIVVSRVTEFESGVSWINASKKLEEARWFSSLQITNAQQLPEKYKQELDQRHFLKVNDPKFIEISINQLLFSEPSRILSVLNLLDLDICDESLFARVLEEKRSKQESVTIMNDIVAGKLTNSDDHAVASIINDTKEKK